MKINYRLRPTDSLPESNISLRTNKEGSGNNDPIIQYYYGLAVGARAGVCPQWHVQTSNYQGHDYFAEKDGDTLCITISVDEYSRTNSERVRRRLMDTVSFLTSESQALTTQVENTRRARTLALAELERLDPGQVREREIKELVLESWDKTLEEVSPRLEAFMKDLKDAEQELRSLVAIEAESRIVRLDLSQELEVLNPQ